MNAFLRILLAAVLVWSALMPLRAAVNVEPMEKLIADGKPAEAIALLEPELAKHPRNARLLYDYGVATYAAGRYDDALLAFDKVEAIGGGSLVEKARAQKGNAEFHLGLIAKTDNLDETIERWKTSLDQYKAALKGAPRDRMAKNNFDTVQKLLMDLLLKQAQQKLDTALKNNWTEQKIEQLRDALEKFQEAKQVDPTSEPAKNGERKAREELARTLAKAGEKKATPKPDQPLPNQVAEIEKGVDMLEDANQLLPEDKPIQEQLEKAKETLAQALTEKAKQEIQQAKDSKWDKDKFQKLEKAEDDAQKAQDMDAKNEEAPKVEQEAKDELAKLHEEKGDQLAQQAEHSSLERQTQQLEDALDHYHEAEDLKPDNAPLEAKAEQTEEKLAAALQKLADKLMQDPTKPEAVEQAAARYEQAETALQDLEQIRPSDKTEQQLAEAERRLAALRQQLAEQQRQQLALEKAQQQDQKARNPQQANAQMQEKPPEMEQPLKTKNPEKGQFKSDALAKKGKDY